MRGKDREADCLDRVSIGLSSQTDRLTGGVDLWEEFNCYCVLPLLAFMIQIN